MRGAAFVAGTLTLSREMSMALTMATLFGVTAIKLGPLYLSASELIFAVRLTSKH